MAIDNFIPEFWSTRLRRYLDAALVYAQPQIMNRNWEGEITQEGDTVHIQRVADGATVKTYARNTDMDAPERPDGTTLALLVDQQKYTNQAIDDIDALQVNVDLFNQWAMRTGRNIAKVYDAYAASLLLAGAAAGNAVGTDAVPVAVKADGTGTYTPYKFFTQLGLKLDSSDAPEEDRWAVISPALKAEVLNDPKYVDTGASETRTGKIGEIAGFSILQTTRTPSSPGSGGSPLPNHKVIYGATNYGLTWADQIVKQEPYRIQNQFGDGLKTLNVYGAKVVEPESIGVAHVKD